MVWKNNQPDCFGTSDFRLMTSDWVKITTTNQFCILKSLEVIFMELTLKIEGMMCPHCEARVKKALEAVPGVAEAIPSHDKNNAVVKLNGDVDTAALVAAVEAAGYACHV